MSNKNLVESGLVALELAYYEQSCSRVCQHSSHIVPASQGLKVNDSRTKTRDNEDTSSAAAMLSSSDSSDSDSESSSTSSSSSDDERDTHGEQKCPYAHAVGDSERKPVLPSLAQQFEEHDKQAESTKTKQETDSQHKNNKNDSKKKNTNALVKFFLSIRAGKVSHLTSWQKLLFLATNIPFALLAWERRSSPLLAAQFSTMFSISCMFHGSQCVHGSTHHQTVRFMRYDICMCGLLGSAIMLRNLTQIRKRPQDLMYLLAGVCGLVYPGTSDYYWLAHGSWHMLIALWLRRLTQ